MGGVMADIDSFATPTQMQERSQGQISETTHPFLPSELKAATRAIRDVCGWHVAGVQSVTYKRRGAFSAGVWLPAMEIISIEEATVDGVALDVANVEFDPATGWTNICGRVVEVKFTAGFETVPEALMVLALQVAARALGSPLGVVREQAGTFSATYSQATFNVAAGNQLMKHEVDQLFPYRLGRLP